MHKTTQTMYNTQKWETNMKSMYYRHHTTKTNKTHTSNSTKYPQTIFKHHMFKSQQKTHNPRKLEQEIESTLRKRQNPYLFLEDWWRNDEENGGFVREHGDFGRGRDRQDYEQSQDAREKWKVLENCLENNPHCAKHKFFVIGMSREQVVKNPCDKFWKICLSIFCN